MLNSFIRIGESHGCTASIKHMQISSLVPTSTADVQLIARKVELGGSIAQVNVCTAPGKPPVLITAGSSMLLKSSEEN